MHPVLSLVLAVSFAMAGGCGEGSGPVASDRSDLRIAAAASLRVALEEVLAEFHRHHPDIDARVSYGASGALYAQLAHGAPFDFFLSADVGYPERLAADGQAGEPFIYAVGRLAVWAPYAAGLDVPRQGMGSLIDPRVQIVALANPKVAPYGMAALEAMRHHGVAHAVEGRLAWAEDVAQAAQFVESGSAQVGVIALSLARSPALRERGEAWVVPGSSHAPLEHAGAVITGARNPAAAAALRDFLLGEIGQEVLGRHGFSPPERS